MDNNAPQKKTDKRGFASMDPEKQKQIASKGGRAAHESGHAHEFTPDEAREAGRKGGKAAHAGQRRVEDNKKGSPETPTETAKDNDADEDEEPPIM